MGIDLEKFEAFCSELNNIGKKVSDSILGQHGIVSLDITSGVYNSTGNNFNGDANRHVVISIKDFNSFELNENIVKDLTEALETRLRYQKEIQRRGVEMLSEIFKDLFKQIPAAQAIAWKQYTPYFCDGEPCYFSVKDAGISFKSYEDFDATLPVTERQRGYYDKYYRNDYPSLEAWRRATFKDGGDYGDGFYTRYDFGDEVEHQNVKSILNDISNALKQNEHALEMIFGDHVRVVFTQDGEASIEKYEHD